MLPANAQPVTIEELIAQRRAPEAIAFAEQHARQNRKDYRPLLVLGTAYMAADRKAEALRSWQKAYDLAGDVAEVRLFYLSGLWQSGERNSSRVARIADSLRPDPALFTLQAPFSDPKRLADCLKRYGLAHIKGGISRRQVEAWDQALRDNLASVTGVTGYEHAGELDRQETYVVPSYFIVKQDDPGSFAARFKKGVDEGNPYLPVNFMPEDFARLAQVLPELDETGILPAIALYLGRDKAALTTHPNHSAARVIPGKHNGDGGPHQDGRIQSRTDLFATLWVPFTDCGGTTAPSLSTVPVRLHTYFPTARPDTNDFSSDAFPPEIYFEPRFEVGDVLLHSTFTLHRSLVRSDMQANRRSIDMRIF